MDVKKEDVKIEEPAKLGGDKMTPEKLAQNIASNLRVFVSIGKK